MTRPARGERNNNPGNIRHGSKWQGLSAQQTDPSFCQFVSPEYGIRAIYKLLQTYQKKYELILSSRLSIDMLRQMKTTLLVTLTEQLKILVLA